jgi:hypothetical protein
MRRCTCGTRRIFQDCGRRRSRVGAGFFEGAGRVRRKPASARGRLILWDPVAETDHQEGEDFGLFFWWSAVEGGGGGFGQCDEGRDIGRQETGRGIVIGEMASVL